MTGGTERQPAGMQILGLGTDIVETARVESSIEKFGGKFLNRVFAPGEIAYCAPMKFSARHYAARFAAKEAVAKAFGTGFGAELEWVNVEVCNRGNGEPFIRLHREAEALANRRGVKEIRVSLSHCDHYAVATALLIG